MNRALRCLWIVAACLVLAPAAPAADDGAKEAPAVARYQLVVGLDGRVYVLDTATGQCWSKEPGGQWRDEGSPLDPAAAEKKKAPAGPVRLKLPEKTVKLTILQRRSKPIPGSDERILVRFGDVTAGQTLVSVRTDEGDVLLDDTSLRPGEAAGFRVGEKPFTLKLRELKNFLVGDDFGVVEITAGSPEEKRDEEPEGKAKPAEE